MKKHGYRPNQAEVDAHNVAHWPFRSWCPHCVRGRGQASLHKKSKKEEEGRLPTISLDYGFLGEEDRQSITTIAIVDSKSGAIHGFQVPHMGVADERVAKKLSGWVDALGYKRVIIKSDQEPSVVALRVEMMRMSRTEMVPEFSPVKDSKSNGAAEKAVQTVKRLRRKAPDQKRSLLDYHSIPLVSCNLSPAQLCMSRRPWNLLPAARELLQPIALDMPAIRKELNNAGTKQKDQFDSHLQVNSHHWYQAIPSEWRHCLGPIHGCQPQSSIATLLPVRTSGGSTVATGGTYDRLLLRNTARLLLRNTA